MWSLACEGGDANIDSCMWRSGAPATACALCTLPFCTSAQCVQASPPPPDDLSCNHHRRLR
eukprot:1660526-Lingulodinium_polyedra.AAC.1